MVKQALKPDLFFDFRKIGTLTEQEQPELEAENMLTSLANHNGWLILKDYINDVKDELDMMVTQAMEKGLSREDIGERTILTTLCKEALQKVIDKVEDARR
jgi:hypothetical protein